MNLKALIRINMSIIAVSPTSFLVACNSNSSTIGHFEMNHNLAYEQMFDNYKIIPVLEEKQESNSGSEDVTQTHSKLFVNNDKLQLNCNNFVCDNLSIEYSGKQFTNDMYNFTNSNIEFSEIKKAQFAMDYLASKYNLIPDTTNQENIIYDLKDKGLIVDYNSSQYSYQQINEEKELVLTSSANVNYEVDGLDWDSLDFYDINNKFSLDILNLLVNNNEVDNQYKANIGEIKQNNDIDNSENNEAEIEKKYVLNITVSEKNLNNVQNILKVILNNVDKNLNFKMTEIEEENPGVGEDENQTSNEVKYEYIADLQNKFIMDKYLLSRISISTVKEIETPNPDEDGSKGENTNDF
ncbi:hypothetical protein SCHIN_v1c06370 [Spiroplasma chinense]|uniref:Lipoprotein n=1 Tax=Spiroplasma chinense TaxID=216932 RepID=A0A5B9Y433_9MOLU|nr:hypothetical protein [Spiroplasma chinense]QEH61834.1 hypothetical protein SCHIN_v1c06370 [Spiroplasma chinense]